MLARRLAVRLLLPLGFAAMVAACGGHSSTGGSTAPNKTPYASVTASNANGLLNCFVINAGFIVPEGKAEVQTINQLGVPLTVIWSNGSTTVGTQHAAPHTTVNSTFTFKIEGTYTPVCRVAGRNILVDGQGVTFS